MTTNKNKLCLGVALATVTMATALVSPQAAAHKAKHKAAPHAAAHAHAYAAPSKTDILESQVRVMQDEIASLRAQVGSNAPVVAADAQKVQELDARIATVEAKEVKHKDHHKNNMIYFRGGFAGNDSSMAATTNTVGGSAGSLQLLNTTKGNTDGWNFGAGIDFSLSDNLFGLVDKTEFLGELDLNYVELGSFRSGLTPTIGAFAVTGSPAGVLPGTSASQSMFRITAAPKIKFFEGSKLRPWIIPTGFTLNVISPPSQANAITELMPAMHFGAGVDYNLWKSIYIGTDIRYNMAFGTLNGTNVNGLTAGGSVGFGF